MRSRLVLLALIAAIAASCTAGSQLSGGRSSKAKDDGDGRRPSEQGEGIVGYLHDPNDVHFQNANGVVGASGEAGAVETDDHSSPQGLDVCLQQVAAGDLKTIVGSGAGFGGSNVRTLATGSVNADGSFRVSTSAEGFHEPGSYLAVNVAGRCAHDDTTPLDPNATRVAFKSADAPTFASAATQFPGLVGAGGTTGDSASATGSTDPTAPKENTSAQICGQKDDGACDARIVIELYDASGARITGTFELNLQPDGPCTVGGPTCPTATPVTSYPTAQQTQDIFLTSGSEYIADIFVTGYKHATAHFDAAAIALRGTPAPITKVTLTK